MENKVTLYFRYLEGLKEVYKIMTLSNLPQTTIKDTILNSVWLYALMPPNSRPTNYPSQSQEIDTMYTDTLYKPEQKRDKTKLNLK